MPGQRGNTVSTYRRPRRIAILCAPKDTNDISRRTDAFRPRSWSWSSLGTAGAVARAEAILHPGGSAARRAETQGVARTLRRDVLKFIARRKDVCVSANFLYSVSYRRRGVQLRVSVLLEVRQIAERGHVVSGRSIASPAMRTSCSGCIILRYAKRALDRS